MSAVVKQGCHPHGFIVNPVFGEGNRGEDLIIIEALDCLFQSNPGGVAPNQPAFPERDGRGAPDLTHLTKVGGYFKQSGRDSPRRQLCHLRFGYRAALLLGSIGQSVCATEGGLRCKGKARLRLSYSLKGRDGKFSS